MAQNSCGSRGSVQFRLIFFERFEAKNSFLRPVLNICRSFMEEKYPANIKRQIFFNNDHHYLQPRRTFQQVMQLQRFRQK